MPFSVAWLRLSALAFFLIPTTHAHQNTLFTSSVSYCSPPENLLIQQFDIAFFPSNNSVVFNVSAASVEANVNVTANLALNIYGLRPLNLTINICNLLDGALCPLPLYNFVGAETLQLPSSVDVASHLPGIAYKIPDLEAFAQLTLSDVRTGQLKACVQSTLSNGWSTHQTGVSWATGGIAFLALFSAFWQSFLPEAIAPSRLLDLLYLYQTIASSSLLDLNYPVVYRAFAVNFSWSIGLFRQSPSSSLQRSITHMRNITGGHLINSAADGAVALVNRKLSPYNTPISNFAVPQALIAAAKALPQVDLIRLSDPRYHLPDTLSAVGNVARADSVPTVTSVSDNILQAGIPIYVSSIGVATANAFMTVFFSALILFAITLGILGAIYGALVLASRRERLRMPWLESVKANYFIVAKTWLLRIALICFLPLVMFAFYQWTLKDSWLAVFISVISFLTILGGISYSVFRVLLYARRSTPYILSTDLPSLSPLFEQHRVPRYYVFVIPIVVSFLRSIFIAFAKSKGTVQIIFLVVLEAASFLSLIVLRPGKTRRADVLSIFLATVRLFCTGLLIAFSEPAALSGIPRVVIGIITVVIWSITVVVMFFNTVWNLGLQRLWHRRPFSSLRSISGSSQHSGDDKDKEQGAVNVLDAEDSWTDGGRRNPTPTKRIPLSPEMNQPYPAVTPTTTIMEPTSARSTETSSSYGEQIPSRWRTGLLGSRPPSQANTDSPHTPSPISGSIGAFSVDQDSIHPSQSPSRYTHSRQPTIEEGMVVSSR